MGKWEAAYAGNCSYSHSHTFKSSSTYTLADINSLTHIICYLRAQALFELLFSHTYSMPKPTTTTHNLFHILVEYTRSHTTSLSFRHMDSLTDSLVLTPTLTHAHACTPTLSVFSSRTTLPYYDAKKTTEVRTKARESIDLFPAKNVRMPGPASGAIYNGFDLTFCPSKEHVSSSPVKFVTST